MKINVGKEKASPTAELSVWSGLIGIVTLVLNHFSDPYAFEEPWVIYVSVVNIIMLFLVPRYPLTVWIAYLILYVYITSHQVIGASALIMLACLMGGLVAYRGHLKAAILGAAVIIYTSSVDLFHGMYVPEDMQSLIISVLFIGLPIGIGFVLYHSVGQRKQLMRQWDMDVQQRRETIGRQLHDSVASSLTSLIMRLEGLSLRDDLPEQSRKELVELAEQARVSMKEVRGMLHTLSTDDSPRKNAPAPPVPYQLNLVRACLRDHGFTVTMTGNSGAIRPGADGLLVLKEVFREIATNIGKYADPSETVAIDIHEGAESIRLRFSNAISMRKKATLFSSEMGLPALSQMMESIGGKFAVTSDATNWTAELDIPVRGVDPH